MILREGSSTGIIMFWDIARVDSSLKSVTRISSERNQRDRSHLLAKLPIISSSYRRREDRTSYPLWSSIMPAIRPLSSPGDGTERRILRRWWCVPRSARIFSHASRVRVQRTYQRVDADRMQSVRRSPIVVSMMNMPRGAATAAGPKSLSREREIVYWIISRSAAPRLISPVIASCNVRRINAISTLFNLSVLSERTSTLLIKRDTCARGNRGRADARDEGYTTTKWWNAPWMYHSKTLFFRNIRNSSDN